MAKSLYSCNACGATFPKWAGQCPDCRAWNSLEETRVEAKTPRTGRFAGYAGEEAETRPIPLASVRVAGETKAPTGIGELDRVLGGGLVKGSVVLIGGDPGIGKSTLLLQMMAKLPPEWSTLYVTGEESPQQLGLRAQRLGIGETGMKLLPETCIERVLAVARAEPPQVAVIDSIQTMYTEQLQSAPGSVAQVRESAAQLVQYAKRTGTMLFLVGHVTKEGALAGPRVLEHMVDTVLYFEGESGSQLRMVRSFKNRFGAVNELGVFAMTDKGLREVSNPSAIFLSRHAEPVSGSIILVTREGSRPLLVEVQALVDTSSLANPRRLTLGLEQNRLGMLLAVLHRHGGIAMYDQDVYVNVVGGVRITETVADLPVLLAILSSLRDRPISSRLAAFGEVGLAGEVRPVPNGLDRLQEAVKHGFNRVVLPRANAPKHPPAGIEVVAVSRLREALELV